MKQEDEGMSAAWREAAADLEIRVDAPFSATDSHGQAISCDAFVADFGSPPGVIVTSLSVQSDSVARCLEISGAGAVCTLARDFYRRYERHQWIDLLESLRWYGAGGPPPWYTATSPWHGDAIARETMSGELSRIFGRSVSVEHSAIFRQLYLLPADDVLKFLARVPAGGVTEASFAQWAADVAEEWDQAHPRRLSNER